MIVNSMVALDSSFMIKSLYTFHIPGIDYDFQINTTHVALLIVSVFILMIAIVARIKINKVKATDTPKGLHNAVELVIEMLGNMVNGIMGKNAPKYSNYIIALFIFVIISNISGLFGLRPPTADYGVTFALGMMTFVIIHYSGIRANGGKHFANMCKPALLTPINIIGEVATPISLSLRLFGNIMSGTVMMGLIYDLLAPPVTTGLPAVLHVYFDLFSGCIQAYVFCMLTMVYVNDKIADD